MTQEKLTKKEKDFADAYIETGNGTQSALKAYDTENNDVAGNIASANLKKRRVQQYLEDKAEVAASIIFELAESSDMDNVRLGAAKDIMDRSGYKPVEKSINLNVEAEITNPKARELAEKYEEELKKGL